MKNVISFSVLAFLLLGISYVAIAQAPPVGGGARVPIDGGAVAIVGAGLAYGAKKLYDRKKAKQA